ncbi:MAG: pyruvate dehydrogenase complex dihydrolipoamide acetyltransferase [Pseudomonadota bacterium]
MATEILMPALSPTMEEGTLAKWLVREGDTVASGDLLAEIETDKATMEFEAVDEGVVGKILIAEGTEGVKVNSPIAILVEDGEDVPTASEPAPADTAAPAPVSTAAPAEPASRAPAAPGGARVFATPLARRIAKDKGIDLAAVKGSGPHGRIIKSDVENASAAPAATTAATPAATPAAAPDATPTAAPAASPPAPVMATGPAPGAIEKMYADRDYVAKPLDGMRKTIAARLTEAKQTIPHFYLRRDVDIDALLALRGQINGGLAARGLKLSVNDFIIKACAVALQTVPAANAVWAGDKVLELTPSDVAVAVAIEGGLFTPVLRDAHVKSLSALSTEMKDLATRARDRKLAPHEYQGGSFAISNLGMFGIDNFDAVINPPHGAILAVGAGKKRPVIGADGQVTAATIMSLTLSVDHRVIDGALGAELLGAIVDNLENPLAMLA